MSINVKTTNESPVFEIESRLVRDGTTFIADADRYREGLTLAGVPEPVQDTLNVKIGELDLFSSFTRIKYDSDKNQLRLNISSKGRNHLGEQEGLRSWSKDPTYSDSVNYALAITAQRIAGLRLARPEIVELERRFVSGRVAFTWLGATLGSGAGVALADLAEIYPLFGYSTGFIGGAAIAVGVVELRDRVESPEIDNKDRLNFITRQRKLAKQRELEFAASEEAKRIFSGVVKLELG